MNKEKSISPDVKELFEHTKAFLSTLFDLPKVMFAVGVAVIFTYCFSESISLSGVTFSDALPFFYVAFSFSLILTIGIAFGSYSSIVIFRSLVWIGRRFLPTVSVTYHPLIDGKTPVIFSTIVLAMLTFIPIGMKTPAENNYWGTLLFFLIVGFFVLMLFLSESSAEQPMPKLKKFGVLFIVTIAGLVIYRPTLIDMTMSNVEIRTQSSDYVLLDTKNYEFALALSHSFGLPFLACKIGDTGKWSTRDLRIIWHGIGDKTFVKFTPSTDANKFLPGINSLYPLNRAGIDILRGAGNVLMCK